MDPTSQSQRWTQVYEPHGWPWWASAIIAAAPIAVLFWLLAAKHVSAPRAAAAGALTAILVAILFLGMPPLMALAAFGYGAAYGLFPIGWVVFAAIFLYQIAVDTGQFESMKRSIARLTADRRIQVLLIAFSFGAIIEGAAGFGTPVAISAALLVGLGFRPFQAAVLCLIANTAPVAWGSIGTPLVALAKVSGLPIEDLSAMNARILPITSVIVPIWLVRAMVPWRETLEVLPAALVCGVSFALTQFLWGNFVNVGLVDIVAGLVSLAALGLFLSRWRPRRIWRFPEETSSEPPILPGGGVRPPPHRPRHAASPSSAPDGRRAPATGIRFSRAQPVHHTGPRLEPTAAAGPSAEPASSPFRAWLPFLLLFALVIAWGILRAKGGFDALPLGPLEPSYKVPVPGLDGRVVRTFPVVPEPKVEEAVYDFAWLPASGTGILVAALLSSLFLGQSLRDLATSFARAARRMKVPILAIVPMLGLGMVTRYSGIDAILGLAFTGTGVLYPFFGTFLGWLGVALTGSDTASNVLFGSLQRITAEQLGLDPILMCSANSAGGVMGKMVDAQSIVVAGAASGQVGNEGKILLAVLWHSIALAAIVALIVLAYAYVFPGAVPHGVELMGG